MQANRDASYAFTQGSEGPYSSDPNDNGNWTSGRAGVGVLIGSAHGVTAQELMSWMKGRTVTAEVMRNLPIATAEAIWSARYWQTLRCDDLPPGVDLMLSDFGYNAGDGTAAEELQTLVGLTGADVDRWIGNETLAALTRSLPVLGTSMLDKLSTSSATALQAQLGLDQDGNVGPKTRAAVAVAPAGAVMVVCAALADAQAARYRSLDQFPEYGRGWLNRTWARTALAMKLAAAQA